MSIMSRVRDFLQRDRTTRQIAESDAPAGTETGRTRPTGGVQEPSAPDTHSTTGTTPNETFVGRASGDDPGDAGTTGAEERAKQEDQRQGQRPPDDPAGDQSR